MSASKARGPPCSGAGSPHAGSSSQPLACDFPDQARDDVALGLLGRLQDCKLILREMLIPYAVAEVTRMVPDIYQFVSVSTRSRDLATGSSPPSMVGLLSVRPIRIAQMNMDDNAVRALLAVTCALLMATTRLEPVVLALQVGRTCTRSSLHALALLTLTNHPFGR